MFKIHFLDVGRGDTTSPSAAIHLVILIPIRWHSSKNRRPIAFFAQMWMGRVSLSLMGWGGTRFRFDGDAYFTITIRRVASKSPAEIWQK
jgi:hypothetical protein